MLWRGGGGGFTTIGRHISNTETMAAVAGDKKPILALKIYILGDLTDLISSLVPSQFQESIFASIHVQITGCMQI